jgi:hypothetical protein
VKIYRLNVGVELLYRGRKGRGEGAMRDIHPDSSKRQGMNANPPTKSLQVIAHLASTSLFLKQRSNNILFSLVLNFFE